MAVSKQVTHQYGKSIYSDIIAHYKANPTTNPLEVSLIKQFEELQTQRRIDMDKLENSYNDRFAALVATLSLVRRAQNYHDTKGSDDN